MGRSCRANSGGAAIGHRMLRQSARVICVNCLQQGKPTCYYEKALRMVKRHCTDVPFLAYIPPEEVRTMALTKDLLNELPLIEATR
uniref:Uncharacterized protein n=1 Tax=Globodera rostochiensis TaxID=31243 RepID=A0A914HZV9_GLORO